MSKIFFYDLETTGVDCKANGIHQISGAIVIDGETKETFNFKVAPHNAAVIEAKALEVAGVTEQQIKQYEPIRSVYAKIIALLTKYVDKFDRTDKFHLCGYNNAGFDNQFFRQWFFLSGDKYFGSWFWSDTIDVMVLASYKLQHQRYLLPNFQLKTVAGYLGITVDETKLHDALYDIELTQAIYNKVS